MLSHNIKKVENDVLVIIPMYGKEEYTRRCVELTKKNAGMSVDILVVDDGSPEPYFDDSVNVVHIVNNEGYTGATNQGIIWANNSYRYLHFLNNDTEPYPNFIKVLYDHMEKNQNTAIASSVRYYDKDESKVELFGVDLIRGYQAVMKGSDLEPGKVHKCNWVPVCSSLLRSDVVREVGLLNKKMRNHSSDLEYCLKVKIAEYDIEVLSDSKVFHHHEVTTKSNGLSPEKDQKVLLEVLSGFNYAQFMNVLPLDAEQNTFGKLEFSVYQK